MIYLTHRIPTTLGKYVAEVIYTKDFHPPYVQDKYLPDGSMNIVFELTGNPKYIYQNGTNERIQECRNVWFSGVQNNYITISAESEEMLVLVLKPGAGFPLIHASVAPYSNKVVAAEEVFGEEILLLRQRLMEPPSPTVKFGMVEEWLTGQIREDDFYVGIIRFALSAIESDPSGISLTELADRSGYSHKQFIQLFKKYVGITPKQFQRIIRFNDILAMVEKEEKISWTRIAAEGGYFDQPHFIKDFQSFSGINPRKYLQDIGDYPNFLPVK